MSTLQHRRIAPATLRELFEAAPESATAIGDEQRGALAARFRASAGSERTLLDAWSVESAGRPSTPFRWRPANARRVVGNAALRRLRLDASFTVSSAVRDEVDELLVRCAAGYARPGSLSHWLGGQGSAVIALVVAEATTWATALIETLEPTRVAWLPVPVDAYYDVAGARTTLRGRRDGLVGNAVIRVLVRMRSGQPGRFAGPGLRADLVADALADPLGRCATRIVGIWPDAGVALSVDGTLEDVRAGARDFVRASVMRRRNTLQRAA